MRLISSSYYHQWRFPPHCGFLRFLLLSRLVLLSTSASSELTPRCGDCWCVYHGNADSCPTNTTGIEEEFPSSFEIYTTFNLTNADADFLKLRTPDGEPCWPFQDTVGYISGNDQTKLPQCALYESTEETVCAFKFEQGTPCEGRNYEVLTYDSASAAVADGAVVTHEGACGVCSNAYDLWGRMQTLQTFDTETLVCGALYLLSKDDNRFDQLVDCAMKAGLSSECARLWAYYGVAVIEQCEGECQADVLTGVTTTNGPPPECELTECMKCPLTFGQQWSAMAGRIMPLSGMVERQARNCTDFYPVIHDPCVGAADHPLANFSIQSTDAPASASSSTSTGAFSLLLVLFWEIAVGFLE